MPQTCPRCQSPGRLPGHATCASCGAPVLAALGELTGPRLSGHFEGGALQEFALGPKTSLGRHPANVLCLGDREVSKEHAVIEQRGPQFVVRDLGSSNGTFVNGKRIHEHVLREGDELVLGASRFLFRAGPSEGAARGVTVLAGHQQQPAILALLEPEREDGFRPADQIMDVASLRRDYEKLRIAHEFQRQTGTERDAKALLEKILSASFELVPADNGVLFLHDAERGLTPAAVKRRDARQTGDVTLSETLLQQVMDTRRAVLTADAIIDARFSGAESIVAQGIRSAMAVPLLSGNALRGVLFVDSRERSNAFNEKDLKLLAGLAGHAAIALENVELAGKIEREAVTRAELSRFLSPAVAEMVVQGRVELLRQGRLEEVSVLFADIRGFTSMAEHDQPQEVVVMLNAFFTRMADVIFRHEGNLDKFIGDCVMAVWGPPSSHPDDAARALRAGLEMQQEVELLNLRRAGEGKPPLEVGIGINTGLAVVGYMGSAERHEFTAIGDSVNTASRLCGLARGGEVIATEATLTRAGAGFEVEPLPAVNVKGKERGISAFRILGHEGTSVGLT